MKSNQKGYTIPKEKIDKTIKDMPLPKISINSEEVF